MTNTPTTALTGLEVANQKIDSLLALNKITPTDIENLSQLECRYLSEKVDQLLAQLTGEARDELLDKIDLLLPADDKNKSWERNHAVISNAISKLMRQYGTMPTKTSIAQETGLSRQAVTRHLKEYKLHPEFEGQTERFKLMANKVLANVFKLADNGDIKAARLYLETVGAINKRPTGTVVNRQNNYIQINNTILSQETLKQLSTEQLNQIEKIVTGGGLRGV